MKWDELASIADIDDRLRELPDVGHLQHTTRGRLHDILLVTIHSEGGIW